MTEKRKGPEVNGSGPRATNDFADIVRRRMDAGQPVALPCPEDEHDFVFKEFSSANWWDVIPFFEKRPGQVYEVRTCRDCNSFAVRPVGRESDEVTAAP